VVVYGVWLESITIFSARQHIR